MIYRIVKDLVARAAARLETDDPHQTEKLRRASTHWFRHTSITHQADAGIELRHLQRNARHARLDTTGLYLHAEEKRNGMRQWNNTDLRNKPEFGRIGNTASGIAVARPKINHTMSAAAKFAGWRLSALGAWTLSAGTPPSDRDRGMPNASF